MDISALLEENKKIPLEETQCLQALLRLWKEKRPLFQKKILINCHLTLATLLLIELFLFSGAELKITCTDKLVCHDSIRKILQKMGLYLSPDDVSSAPYDSHYFDVVMDCGGYLAHLIQPNIGFVELTHVNTSCYEKTGRPVLSVDNSFIKQIETTFGTGDGFLRAIEKLYAQLNQDYKNKMYMIFGFGKVGEGIYTCLNRSGVSKDRIIIIEANEKAALSAQQKGLSAFLVSEREAIRNLLKTSVDCAVTATGVHDSISQHFLAEDFKSVEFLCNMGTYDEWGYHFSDDMILHQKRPLNFILDKPTKIKYLDPVFTLYATAVLELIEHPVQNISEILAPSVDTQKDILFSWLEHEPVYAQEIKQLWNNSLSNAIPIS